MGALFDTEKEMIQMKQQNAPPVLRRVRRLDSIRLDADDRTYFTEEGYLVDHPVLTSVGIFEYRNPDGSVRRELRLPGHVFAEKSLKTYRGKPVIITHSAGKISKNNVDREQIGTILSDGYQDGDDVRAEIIIHNTDAMKSSGLKELSLGYNLDLIEEPGEWNGQPYDAVQTNIVINHLALVASARAGDQARLNIDGSDEPELKGGKVTASGSGRGNQEHLPSGSSAGVDDKKNKGGKKTMANLNIDGFDMTPEQMVEAISQYKASHEAGGAAAAAGDGAGVPGTAGKEPPVGAAKQEPAAGEVPPAVLAASAAQEPPAAEPEKKDADDLTPLIAAVEQLLAALKAKGGNTDGAGREGTEPPASTGGGAPAGVKQDGEGAGNPAGCGKEDSNTAGSGDMSRSLNADSADDLFRQRLGICRVGDRLGLEGLEAMSIPDGKKAVIAKVLPDMRLDGKDTAYVDAAYDIAVEKACSRKDVDYQRQQMAGGTPPGMRTDGVGSDGSMASRARQKMIDREGGSE